MKESVSFQPVVGLIVGQEVRRRELREAEALERLFENGTDQADVGQILFGDTDGAYGIARIGYGLDLTQRRDGARPEAPRRPRTILHGGDELGIAAAQGRKYH